MQKDRDSGENGISGGFDKKIEELTEENRRLNYRIKHLARGVQELQENKVLIY